MPLIGKETYKSSDLRGRRGWAPASVGRSICPCACPAHAGPRSSAPAGSRQHGVVSSADTACTKQERDLHAGKPSMTGPTVRPCRTKAQCAYLQATARGTQGQSRQLQARAGSFFCAPPRRSKAQTIAQAQAATTAQRNSLSSTPTLRPRTREPPPKTSSQRSA